MDTIKTDNEGGFITPDFVVKGYGGVRDNRYMTKIHLYYLSREGIHKVIDAKEYYEYKFHKRDYHKKDTIDLGIIYFEDFEDLENFDDEEPWKTMKKKVLLGNIYLEKSGNINKYK